MPAAPTGNSRLMPFCVTLVLEPRGDPMQKKRRFRALVGCLTVIVCICLGVFYDFAQGPTCWKCWSSKSVALAENKKFWTFSSSETMWHCHACSKVWRPGLPWDAETRSGFLDSGQLLAK